MLDIIMCYNNEELSHTKVSFTELSCIVTNVRDSYIIMLTEYVLAGMLTNKARN